MSRFKTMSRFKLPRLDALCVRILARFGVDPAAGDLAADVPRVPRVESPYECAPTTWGVEPTPEPHSPSSAPAPPAPKPLPRRLPAVPRSRRGRQRPSLEPDREPTPRGLLLS